MNRKRLRFVGYRGLRLVDASGTALIVFGNTTKPTAMIAINGADLFLADSKTGGWR